MNYRTLVKGALALSLSLIVGSASASTTTTNDVQQYGAMFETTANTPVGAFNDYDYEIGSNITAYANATTGVGWFSGDPEQDESKIVTRTDAAGGQALQLNTDASTLTNKFATQLASDLNGGIAAAGAYFETEVKFVPSDTLDAGITGGQDATKFAIYAYANEDVDPPVTNLVVYHGVMDAGGHITYTNEKFDVEIDATQYVTLRVEMKKLEDPENEGDFYNVFSVKVGNNDALSSKVALDALFGDKATGIWFLTTEDQRDEPSKLISSLNFKGTGEIDNIKAGVIDVATKYDVTFKNGDTTLYTTNYAAGETAVYVGETPTKAADASNTYAFSGWDPELGAVNADTIYTAQFTATPITYAITFVNYDDSQLFTTNVPAGDTPVYMGATPTKAADAENTYEFSGWDPALYAADKVQTYTAQFTATPITPAGDDYEAGNEVPSGSGVTISAGMATWLNNLKTAKNMTKAELEAAFDNDDLSLTEEYLLNTDPTVATTIAFNISSIAVGNTVDLNVALTRTENNAAITTAINGTLKIYGATSLDGSFAADQTLTDKFNGGTPATKSFTTANKFFKAVIEE